MAFMRLFLSFLVLMVSSMAAVADTVLYMAEEHGCYWCERWNEEIAHIYPKTEAGQAAPLQRFDLGNGTPASVEFSKSVHYTPTFIIVQDNKEIGRIEGYPGEDFFWPMLETMLADAEILTEQADQL